MLLLYTPVISPRLLYITDFLSGELFDIPIEVTTSPEVYNNSDLFRINYSPGEMSAGEFYLKPVPLLFENGISAQRIDCFELNFHKAFFETEGDFPFDLFAATFYLLSRYEEYLPHEKDAMGRFPHTQSLAFKESFLQHPLVNIWLAEFSNALLKKFPNIKFRHKQFAHIITYDIETAYKYLHQGRQEAFAGITKSLFTGRWNDLAKRWRVTQGKEKDPYDCYEWLDALHLYCRLKPFYFFLVAKENGRFDKNTPTGKKAFRALIEYYASTYNIGLQSSWQSSDHESLLKEEHQWLEVVADKRIIHNRQHRNRLSFPGTYRRLIKEGIEKDYSMGYDTIPGFRASTCSAFYWYDLPNEAITSMLIYPFCFQDTSSIKGQNHSPIQAYKELMQLYDMVKRVNGLLITTWHNDVLGNQTGCKAWREMFEVFMRETVYWDAYYDEG